MRAELHHEFAVLDEGATLRRGGALTIAGGAVLGLCGLATLTLARITWSGYLIQGLLAVAGGLVAIATGWHLLRRGDRQGPRLVSFVRPPAVITPRPIRQPVPCLPYAALPAARPPALPAAPRGG